MMSIPVCLSHIPSVQGSLSRGVSVLSRGSLSGGSLSIEVCVGGSPESEKLAVRILL